MSIKKTYRLGDDLTLEELQHFQEASIVGIDCEMTGLNPHRDKLCLIQLSDGVKPAIVIKTMNWEKAKNLKRLMLDQTITKVFHFAIMDCAFILKHLEVEVSNAYCTKIASRISRTYSQEHSLSTLIEELCKVKLDKSRRSSDWCRDVLSEEQLIYAVNDVIWLVTLKSVLDKMLESRGYLPTGISYAELNDRCQKFIPILVHLWVNGWDFGREDGVSVFSH